MNETSPQTNNTSPTSIDQGNQIQGDQYGELEQFDQHLERVEGQDEGSVSIRSLTRLLIGGFLIGREELVTRLGQWERDSRLESPPDTRSAQSPSASSQRTVIIDSEQTSLPITPPVGAVAPPPPPAPVATSSELSHVLIGFMFETQSRMAKRRKKFFKRAGQTTSAFMSPMMQRVEESELLAPSRKRFAKLVARGELVTATLAERGRIEEAHSRRLTTTAGQEVFNSSMNELGQAPALQGLVRKQSAGLTRDALDEARVRTVSGDALAEQLARRLLRRAPRKTLPKPAFLVDLDHPAEKELRD